MDAIANALIYVNLAMAVITTVIHMHNAYHARPAYRPLNVMFAVNTVIMVAMYVWLISAPATVPIWAGRVNLTLVLTTLMFSSLTEFDRVRRSLHGK